MSHLDPRRCKCQILALIETKRISVYLVRCCCRNVLEWFCRDVGLGSMHSVFGPCGSVTQRYGSGSESSHHKKISKKTLDFYCFLTSLSLFICKEWCTVPCTSTSKSKKQKNNPYHPDLYQNVTDPDTGSTDPVPT
jgi:hypothetical protein